MNWYQYLFWLSEQSLLIYALPFNLTLLALLHVILRTDLSLYRQRRVILICGMLQFFIPILFVTVGTALRHEHSFAPSLQLLVPSLLLLLFGLQIIITIIIVWNVKHDRLLVASLSGVEMFVSFTTMLVAFMSISGDWI